MFGWLVISLAYVVRRQEYGATKLPNVDLVYGKIVDTLPGPHSYQCDVGGPLGCVGHRVLCVCDRFITDLQNHVTRTQAGLIGGGIRIHLRDQCSPDTGRDVQLSTILLIEIGDSHAVQGVLVVAVVLGECFIFLPKPIERGPRPGIASALTT